MHPSIPTTLPRPAVPPANPAGPGEAGLSGGIYSNLPPWLFQPRDGPTVQREGSVLIPPLTTAEVLRFEPGVGYQLVVQRVGFDANDPTALTQATFQFQQPPGNPVQGFGSLSVGIGTMAQPADVFILAPGPGPLVLLISNNFAGSAWTYFARIVGWTFLMPLGTVR